MAGEQGKYSRNVRNRQEALRLQKQQAALEKAAERERKLQETATGKAEAERLNADLAARVAQLESILGQGLDREAAARLNAMLRHDEFPALDLGWIRASAAPRPERRACAPAQGVIAGLFGGKARHDRRLALRAKPSNGRRLDYNQAPKRSPKRISEKTSRHEAAHFAHQNEVERDNGHVAKIAAACPEPRSGETSSTTWNSHCPNSAAGRYSTRGRGCLFAPRGAGGRAFRAASSRCSTNGGVIYVCGYNGDAAREKTLRSADRTALPIGCQSDDSAVLARPFRIRSRARKR